MVTEIEPALIVIAASAALAQLFGDRRIPAFPSKKIDELTTWALPIADCGSALFVLAVAFINNSEIKWRFDDAATIAAHQTAPSDGLYERCDSVDCKQL
jgi:hypothetical protein